MKRFFLKQLALVFTFVMLIPITGFSEEAINNVLENKSLEGSYVDEDQQDSDEYIVATQLEQTPEELDDMDLPSEDELDVDDSIVYVAPQGEEDDEENIIDSNAVPEDSKAGSDTTSDEQDNDTGNTTDKQDITSDEVPEEAATSEGNTDAMIVSSMDNSSKAIPENVDEKESNGQSSSEPESEAGSESEMKKEDDAASEVKTPSDAENDNDSSTSEQKEVKSDDSKDPLNDKENGIIAATLVEEAAEVECNSIDLYSISSEVENHEIGDIMEGAEHSITELVPASNTILEAGDTIVSPLNPLKKTSGYIPNRYITWDGGSSSWSHLATDYDAYEGQNVMSIANGFVKETGYNSSSGNYVVIEHSINGVTVWSRYQHFCQAPIVNKDSPVSAGQTIGYAGHTGNASGPHLHIQIYSGTYPTYVAYDRSHFSNYALNQEVDGPIEKNGTIFYNPERIINGVSTIGNPSQNSNCSTLQFTNVAYPATYVISNKGWDLGSGMLESNYDLQSLKTEIVSTSGTVISSFTRSISGKAYSIRSLDTYETSDNGVHFSWIKTAGNYKWILTAKDSGNRILTLEMPFTAVTSGSTSTATMSKAYEASSTNNNTTSTTPTTKNNNTSSTTANSTKNIPSLTVTKSGKKYKAKLGLQIQLKLNGKQAKSYKSSKPNIVSVSSTGLLTIKAIGKAKITITLTNKKKLTLQMRGYDPTIPTKLSLSIPSTTIETGGSITLTPVIPNGTNTTYTWKTSNKNVATVTNGTVKFNKKGRVTITCIANRGNKKAKVTFRVKK